MDDFAEERVYTVSQVTGMVKSVLEGSLPAFWVEGEISNFHHHGSGHMYFTLKDEGSQLPSVMFRQRNARLAFPPADGARVVAMGRIRVYEPSGRYQLYVERMRPRGVGELAAAFEKLKRKLEREGLFAADRKRPLPRYPRTVAVVTSPTGAAVRDVVRVIRSRAPRTRIVVAPSRVQGAEAAKEIAAAIGLVDEWGGADVVIVGRGGGSIEDLWAFNDEDLARTIAASRTPVISAVGHEVDFTIADFVADARAATPSNAGEIAVPESRETLASVEQLRRRLQRTMGERVSRLATRLSAATGAYAFRLPRAAVERHAQRVDELGARAAAAVGRRVEAARSRLERFAATLAASDPGAILGRGFAAVALAADGRAVRSVRQVHEGDEVRVTVIDGSFDCTVETVALNAED